MSKLMRISDSTVEKLESLSKLTGESKQKLMDNAITLYAYEKILKKANQQYAALKPEELQEMRDEHREWDVTLSDGLRDDE